MFVYCIDFTKTLEHTIATKGSTVFLNCNVSFPDVVECKWKHNGKDVIANNSNDDMSLRLLNVNATNEGTYSCQIMRNNHRLLTSTAKLQILGK